MTVPASDSAQPSYAPRTVGALRYSTAADGSKLVPALPGGTVAREGRRRVPTGQCHAVPRWSPARAACGLLTERMALWPEDDFTRRRVDVCPQCSAAVRAEESAALSASG